MTTAELSQAQSLIDQLKALMPAAKPAEGGTAKAKAQKAVVSTPQATPVAPAGGVTFTPAGLKTRTTVNKKGVAKTTEYQARAYLEIDLDGILLRFHSNEATAEDAISKAIEVLVAQVRNPAA